MSLIDLADSTMLPTDAAGPITPAEPMFAPGTKVEVRRRFDDKWARGFEVLANADDGYRLRRLSDGEEIPVAFAAQDVRRAKKKNETWWY